MTVDKICAATGEPTWLVRDASGWPVAVFWNEKDAQEYVETKSK